MSGECNPSKDCTVLSKECFKEQLVWEKQFLASLPRRSESYRIPVPGDKVTVVGLRKNIGLNGARGEIAASKIDAEGRVAVVLFDGPGSTSAKPRRFRFLLDRLEPDAPLRSASSPTLSAVSMSAPATATVASASAGGASASPAPSRVGSVAGASRVGSRCSGGSRCLGSALSAGARGSLNRGRAASAGNLTAPLPPTPSGGGSFRPV
eukprot:TRINITY_DN11239_c0_g2_i3.p1 TRINITY_DN11239_c0_g2~~TRINITY_DN11239_c0_g2_i3.p1  ORF type:complete len:208 (+),score=24.37 TRINITY_DN11239_c0_g2_i3:78-701(+)